MTRKEYFDRLESVAVDKEKVGIVNELYGTELPEILQKIVSTADEPGFLGDGLRILSFDEVINAESYLHVDFKGKKVIPVADCGENDFVVYHFDDSTWSKFNITDEIVFKIRTSITDLVF